MRKVPGVEELKRICFRSEPDLYRRVSIHVTRLALILGVSANFITVLRILFSIFAVALFFRGHFFDAVLGVFCFQLVLFLDTMDGAIARYNKESSFFGEAMDLMIDHVSSSVLYFLMAGLWAYFSSGDASRWYLSLLTIGLAQYAAFSRALYIEYSIDVEKLRRKNFFVGFFHQDNMRLLLLMLTAGILLGFFWSPANEIMVFAFLAFVLLKIVFLNGFLWFVSRRFPFSIKILCAYALGVAYVACFVVGRMFGTEAYWARSLLKTRFGDVKIIKTLLGVSKA